jgi:hypothetical protein
LEWRDLVLLESTGRLRPVRLMKKAHVVMAERFYYGGLRKEMTIPPSSLPFLAAIYVLCFGLDVTNIGWLPIHPQAVARLACTIWPIAIVHPPSSFSMHVQQFVPALCLGQAHQAAISIIFLSVKLTMGIFAIPVLWGYAVPKPESFIRNREMYEDRFSEPGGYRQEFKKFGGRSLGLLTFMFCWFLLVFEFDSQPILSFDVAEKILLEDILAVLIPAVSYSLPATLLVFVLHALRHRKTS